jgi:AraC family transcriptional regulator
MSSEQTSHSCRACTVAARSKAVERVILAMRERLAEPLSLQEMADIAISSPYHFNRVFRHITGIPPRLFLGGLRIEAAKRLLLTSQLNVIDVCFEMGYDSLGTFTTRFTQLVGLPPTSLRRMAEHVTLAKLNLPSGREISHPPAIFVKSGLTGRITAPENFDGLIFVGLFSLSIPQAEPVSCALLTRPGEYRLAPVPDGHYYVMVAALNKHDDTLSSWLTDNALRGKVGPIVVRAGRFNEQADVPLRPPRLTDPPIIIALPFLLAQRPAGLSSVAI